MKQPLVSIIMPAYNAHERINNSVKSVLTQTHPNWELLIISDDKSNYQTTLKKNNVDDLRIKYLETGENGSGPSNAKNYGLKNANGEAIYILDSDDTFETDYIESTLDTVLAHGACHTPRNLIGSDGNKIEPAIKKDYSLFDKEKASIKDYINKNYEWQTAYKTELIDFQWEVGFVDQDIIFESRLFDKIGYAPMGKVFGYNYYIRNGSICHDSNDSHLTFLNIYKKSLLRLQNPKDMFGLKEETATLLAELFSQRINNIDHYIVDLENNNLAYNPVIISDILNYSNNI